MNKFCYYWINTSPKWSSGDWTWSECETASDICKIWATDNQTWKDSNMWWSLCYGSGSVPPEPPIIISASLQPPGVDATELIQPWLIESWNPYKNSENDKKRKRLIKLICKVNGKRYEEEKEVGNMKVSVDDIKMIVKKVLNVDLDIKKLEE